MHRIATILEELRPLRVLALTYTLAVGACAQDAAREASLPTGTWRAWLDSPGGELPFGIELREQDGQLDAWLLNGVERIPVSVARFANQELVLPIAHYDAEVRARLSRDATRLDGEWKKRSGPDTWSKLDFHATHGAAARFVPHDAGETVATPQATLDGRWAVDFSSDDQPAVAQFEIQPDGSVAGTFLTATGDYRYLAGDFEQGRLRLSCFDGAHAFLFHAAVQSDGSLAGDFWSRDTWHETWTARRDATASTPDAMQLTRWIEGTDLSRLVYPDLDGTMRSLADPEFAGKVRLIKIFGSWCPNCNDASAYVVQLHERYRERGLVVVGLAFEITGNLDRDRQQVKRYARMHGIEYPILVAGISDKAAASKAFPALDRVRAFPTTIFMDRNNAVRAIHTGFSGPATGEAYGALRREFETMIEQLLSES